MIVLNLLGSDGHRFDESHHNEDQDQDGVSKKEAMTMAHKQMRSKPDHRRAHRERDWADIKPK